MSKIYYFTTAQSIDDFAASIPLWSKKPNTSNQNFHNKLIRAIATIRPVEVISVRPINRHFSKSILEEGEKKEERVHWKYIKVTVSHLDKALNLGKRIKKAISAPENDDVVFVDVLNLSLLKTAIKFARKNALKIIGVVTDDPRNISFTTKRYAETVIKLAQTLDGYVCLTIELERLFNKKSTPFAIIDGVTEEHEFLPEDKPKQKYIFFCGSLMHEYGVYNLIKAFDNLKLKDVDLVICGHHEEDNFQAFVNTMEHVKYVGTLSYLELAKMEAGAILAINPRPINERIDAYSIPSKTLEFLANGALTVSVHNELLKKNYESVIIWSDSGEVEDLQNAITKALSLSEKEKADMISAGKKIVKSRTSFEIVANQIEQLL